MHAKLLCAACCAAVIFISISSGVVFAQVEETEQPMPEAATTTTDDATPTDASAQPGSTQPPMPTAAEKEAAEKAAQQQKKQEHLQKIQQLQFDRRPSTILKLWSLPAGSTLEDLQKLQAGSPEPEPPPSQPMGDAQQPPPAPDPFDGQLKQFQRNVTLGQWVEVKKFLLEIDPDLGKAAYRQMLQGLVSPQQNMQAMNPQQMAQMQAMQRQAGLITESNSFNFHDVLGITSCTPFPLDEAALQQLGNVVIAAIQQGSVVEQLVELLNAEQQKAEQERILSRRQSAQILTHAGQEIHAAPFLPSIEEAERDSDHQALNLLSRVFLSQYAKENKPEFLQKAWQVTQSILSSKEIKPKEKEAALTRSVELAPKVQEELGRKWLEESFTNRPERGMEILATIGGAAAGAMQTHNFDADYRLKGLKLQTTAVEALLNTSSERATEWKSTLSLLSSNWLREALFSYEADQSSSSGPTLRRDAFGNLFWTNEDDGYPGMMYQQQQQGAPIRTVDLMEIKPSDKWLSFVDVGLQPKFDRVFAQLYLKINEDNKAFPYIEGVAKTNPEQGKQLVDELLTVWTNNHDPNAARNRTNFYMFMYGFERKAESIPLTRSKQQRNLKELAELVQRLKELPIEDLNDELLARAFTTCHSSAEVYQLDAIRQVFGPVESLKPERLAALAEQMRGNLGGLWRKPEIQEENSTNRKQKDIEQEVLRGYAVAQQVVADALAKHPDNWSLESARASLLHDENNFRRELGPDTTFTENRDDAMQGFQHAASLYAGAVPTLEREKETTSVFDTWFYACLGASDLQFIDEETQPDLRQPALIRQAILALPGDAAERHMGIFANGLFTRMSALKPAIKHRYLKAGFEIVGNHKQAAEARKVFDYYSDLITELQLETVIDGSDVVGQEPFGVFVNIKHTREIERESGGFGRYLQNQNNNLNFSYNYGRPTENYRDKFQEIVQQALGEQFEVLSVTFQDEKVNSRAVSGEYGWRYTPYAYMLLKARSPSVDKIPPVRLDFDFLDTSGYVILPVESSVVPIDASKTPTDSRPFSNLEVVQTLDERQANEGKLVLEIKATAHGLVPDLDAALDLDPKEFEVVQTDDQGLSVSKFNADSPDNVVDSERSWLVTLNAKKGLAEQPKSFEFAAAKVDDVKLVFQRYVDADLAEAERVVSLEARYGKPRSTWPWIVGGAVLAAILIGACTIVVLKRPRALGPSHRYAVPSDVTPFTVLGLLRSIQQNNGLNESGHHQLAADIQRIERFYFADNGDDPAPDLHRIAESWARQAR